MDPDIIGTVVGPSRFLQNIEKKIGVEFTSYQGSQTVPPCKPGLNWVIAKNPLKIQLSQVGLNCFNSTTTIARYYPSRLKL